MVDDTVHQTIERFGRIIASGLAQMAASGVSNDSIHVIAEAVYAKAALMVRDAVETERERAAKVVEEMLMYPSKRNAIAAAIRGDA